VATSPHAAFPVPVVGIIAVSADQTDSRFIPLVTLNSDAGLDFMIHFVEYTSEFGPRLPPICVVQPQYEAQLVQTRRKFGECMDEKFEDWVGQTTFTLIVGGGFCLFPPTAAAACPLMAAYTTIRAYCLISSQLRALNRMSNFVECMCEASANNWDASGCEFVCPDCISPDVPVGG
jgi:hypothetical protein